MKGTLLFYKSILSLSTHYPSLRTMQKAVIPRLHFLPTCVSHTHTHYILYTRQFYCTVLYCNSWARIVRPQNIAFNWKPRRRSLTQRTNTALKFPSMARDKALPIHQSYGALYQVNCFKVMARKNMGWCLYLLTAIWYSDSTCITRGNKDDTTENERRWCSNMAQPTDWHINRIYSE